MKKLLPAIFLIAFIINAKSQTNLYENPQFDDIAKTHKSIAITPFKTQVKLRPKQMKDMTSEQLDRIEKSEGEGIQTAMYSWFLKRKKRGDMQTIEIQDPKATTALLNKKDINYTNISNYTPQELAEILGVDAVISGDFETDKPMSEGASIALGLLVGFWGSTNSAVINMSVHNAEDGVLLWNYNKKVKGGMGSSSEDLINILMRKASRRLSYTKS
ncbi:hypothetical protein BXY82_1310 [Gelidibacter sediminis]|uniref:Secreted protein n=1 Tax=Gelidibacter sediminis TaxID=1608710 RepID=A0A4R7QA80_9FLAO|nr:hypothetical protein [Gelidibacter sediminis]TDU43889.1 hypothetical protein BXY82_1310 [Gelidibacter sediminis]